LGEGGRDEFGRSFIFKKVSLKYRKKPKTRVFTSAHGLKSFIMSI